MQHRRRRLVQLQKMVFAAGQAFGRCMRLGNVFDRSNIARQTAFGADDGTHVGTNEANIVVATLNAERHFERLIRRVCALPLSENRRAIAAMQFICPAALKAL